jgi:hypothetical protein
MISQYDVRTNEQSRHRVRVNDPAHLRRAGVLCAVGGLIAVVGTAWGFTWSVPGADAMISAPRSVSTFRWLELVWTLTHVLTLFGALGLVRSGKIGTSHGGRIGGRLAVIGMALLIPCELAFIPVAASTDSDPGPIMASTAIGIASVLAGAGFVIAGVAVLRARMWTGPVRVLPLLTGVWVFVGMTPLIIADGRFFYVGIGSWNVLLAGLGLALVRLGSDRRG